MKTALKSETTLASEEGKLSPKEKISYGFGDLASNFVWGMVTSYLLVFYTDTFGISAAAVGTLFLITRIWDAVNDPIMGILVDRTRSKYGKARPYLLYLAIPFGIISVLTFITPDFSQTGKIIYAYITYFLLGMTYTAINLPYGAMMPSMTKDTKEKSELSSSRTIGMGIGKVVVSAAILPLVHLLGNGNDQVGFPLTMGLVSIIGVVLFFLTFRNCKERYSEQIEAGSRESIGKSIKKMFKNKPWVMVAIVALLKFLRLGALNAILVYYVKYVIGAPSMVPVYLTLLNLADIGGGLIALPVLKRIGSKKGLQISLSIGVLLFIVLAFMSGSAPILFAAIFFIANIFFGVDNAAIFVMLGDSIDYHQWKFGQRLEGLLYSAYSFATKFGVAIGSSLVAYALAGAHYDPHDITEAAKNVISILFLATPIAFSAFQVITLLFYKLDKHHAQIVKELNGQG